MENGLPHTHTNKANAQKQNRSYILTKLVATISFKLFLWLGRRACKKKDLMEKVPQLIC